MSYLAKPLEGCVALITGGGTGIGLGIARTFAKAGCSVALGGRRIDVLEQAVAEIEATGGRCLAVQGDVSRSAQARQMVEQTVAGLGELHLLVNNAGIARQGPLDQLEDDDIHSVIDIDLKGPIFVIRAALPHLRLHRAERTAAIVNISSSVTLSPLKDYSVYSAAKAGVDTLTRCLALDLAEDRIRVNAICPGVVQTGIFATMFGEQEAKARLAEMDDFVPLGRIGTPSDVARAVLFFCSPANDWLTGAVVPLDGGLSLSG